MLLLINLFLDLQNKIKSFVSALDQPIVKRLPRAVGYYYHSHFARPGKRLHHGDVLFRVGSWCTPILLLALFYLGVKSMCKTRYVFAFCACGRGRVLFRNSLSGNVCFYVFILGRYPKSHYIGVRSWISSRQLFWLLFYHTFGFSM